jgi:hypothetical protein
MIFCIKVGLQAAGALLLVFAASVNVKKNAIVKSCVGEANMFSCDDAGMCVLSPTRLQKHATERYRNLTAFAYIALGFCLEVVNIPNEFCTSSTLIGGIAFSTAFLLLAWFGTKLLAKLLYKEGIRISREEVMSAGGATSILTYEINRMCDEYCA